MTREPDLFDVAGIALEQPPQPAKRRRAPPPPTPPAPVAAGPSPAERAATARRRGARRPACSCADEHRARVGAPRDLTPTRVIGFPLSRNVTVLGEIVQRLPHFYADNFEKRWASVGRSYEQKLIRHGIPKDTAYESARSLLDVALDVRWREAMKEENRI